MFVSEADTLSLLAHETASMPIANASALAGSRIEQGESVAAGQTAFATSERR